jgi:hypothetical protein
MSLLMWLLVGGLAMAKPSSEPPAPPPVLTTDPWLKVPDPPLDCAPLALNTDCFKPGTWWVWKVGAKASQPLEVPQQLKMSIWAVPADGLIAVFSTRHGWSLARTESVHPEWVWVHVPDPTEEDTNGNPTPQGGCLLKCWDYPLDAHLPRHPAPDAKGWTTYTEIEQIQPVPGEELRSGPSLDSSSYGPLRSPTGNKSEVGSPVELGPLKLLKFRGDWVEVEEALETEGDQAGLDEEHIPLLKVRWNANRRGWIRWRVPGPIPGTWSIRLRAKAEFGIID